MPGGQNPVPQRDWDDAHLINAALDIHADDPAFGYRFIADELPARGITAGENRVARLCSQQRIWSVFSKKRGLNRKAGPPVHDDLVGRQFTAAGAGPDLADRHHRAPHRRGQALPVRDQGRVLQPDRRLLDGRPDDRGAGRLRAAQRHRAALTRRNGRRALGPGQPVPVRTPSSGPCASHGLTGSMGRVGACGDNAAMESFFALLQKNVLDRQRWATRERAAPGDHHLDRAHLPPPPPATTRSAASHPSNTRQSTRPHTRPEPPSPRVN